DHARGAGERLRLEDRAHRRRGDRRQGAAEGGAQAPANRARGEPEQGSQSGEARRQGLQPARRLRPSAGALGLAAGPRVLRLCEARGRRRARGPSGPRKGVRRRLRAAPGVRKSRMDVLLANPRGFCAGVERAIEIVERALDQFGAPIYVRHEIVHNKFVVEDLRSKGAVFVDELEEAPTGGTVVFSAHGVSKAGRAEAGRRGLQVSGGTSPLVTNV